MFSRAPPMLDSSVILAEEDPNNLSRGPTRLLSERHQAGDLRHTDTQAHLQKRKCSLSGTGYKNKGSKIPWIILMCTQE